MSLHYLMIRVFGSGYILGLRNRISSANSEKCHEEMVTVCNSELKAPKEKERKMAEQTWIAMKEASF